MYMCANSDFKLYPLKMEDFTLWAIDSIVQVSLVGIKNVLVGDENSRTDVAIMFLFIERPPHSPDSSFVEHEYIAP